MGTTTEEGTVVPTIATPAATPAPASAALHHMHGQHDQKFSLNAVFEKIAKLTSGIVVVLLLVVVVLLLLCCCVESLLFSLSPH